MVEFCNENFSQFVLILAKMIGADRFACRTISGREKLQDFCSLTRMGKAVIREKVNFRRLTTRI